jgi:hypothetical protein
MMFLQATRKYYYYGTTSSYFYYSECEWMTLQKSHNELEKFENVACQKNFSGDMLLGCCQS